jgi:hypothetical protein
MKILKFEGYSWKECLNNTQLLCAAVSAFLTGQHNKVHMISFSLANLVSRLGLVGGAQAAEGATLSISGGKTTLKNASGEVIAIISLRKRSDIPADGIWAVTTDDGFSDYTKKRADGCGIVGKYEYGFGLGYKRPPLARREYFKERRDSAHETYQSKTKKDDNSKNHNKPSDRRRNQAPYRDGRGQRRR